MTSQKRVVDFDSGVAMVVTDLHGDGQVFQHVRDTFLELYQSGEVQRLILCGDLIHGYGKEQDDHSLSMLLDVMNLQQALGRDKIVLLMGNHEMPHVYGMVVSKGEVEFTSRFERALSRLDKQSDATYRRKDVMAFLCSLPLYVRTKAGVLITHAGASPAVKSVEIADVVLNFDHEALIKLTDDMIQRDFDIVALKRSIEYATKAIYYHALDDEYDPRFTDLLRAELLSQSNQDYRLLWDVLFTTNEQGWHVAGYSLIVEAFLQHISALSSYEQRVIVAGHIEAAGGYQAIGTQQLRLASFAHSKPRHEGRFLLLDCAKSVQTAADLIPHLRKTFAP